MKNIKSIKRFLYSKITSKDELNPLFHGLYYNNGEIVATNGYILAILKADYESELEGQIIDRKGNAIEGTFPPYQGLIPFDHLLTDIYNYSERIKTLKTALNEIEKDECPFLSLINGMNDLKEAEPLVARIGYLEISFKLFSLIGESPSIYARTHGNQVINYMPLLIRSESCTVILIPEKYNAELTYHFDMLW